MVRIYLRDKFFSSHSRPDLEELPVDEQPSAGLHRPLFRKKLHSPRSSRHRISPQYPSVFLGRHSYQAEIKEEKAVIDEAREWGARDGFMVPIVARSGSVSGFCPCGFEPNLSPRVRAALEVIAIYSHHALRRALLALQREKVAHTPLTPREREIMQWVAAGKTDDEIGEILTLGTSTVASHIENAKRKLDTFRRSHAIPQAIRLGEISL